MKLAPAAVPVPRLKPAGTQSTSGPVPVPQVEAADVRWVPAPVSRARAAGTQSTSAPAPVP